jgi:hypothetical protein
MARVSREKQWEIGAKNAVLRRVEVSDEYIF